MKHEKTFAAIEKLKDVEIELHRLKNALEMASKALDAQRPWVSLTDQDRIDLVVAVVGNKWTDRELVTQLEAKLMQKNGYVKEEK
jgi:hypothetical protein